MRFSLGINYWPRRSAMAMWTRFDGGEIAEDAARIARIGLDTVRFFIRWDAIQPVPDACDPTVLARVEQLVGIFHDAGLRVMPTLFSGHMSGVNWLPSWTLDRSAPHGRFRTITERGESPYGVGDLYTGELLDAQRVQARALGERLRGHPAIVAWDLGNEFSNLREPARERDAELWSRTLSGDLHETSGLPVTGGIHGEDLTRDRQLRPSSICAPWAFATMHGYPVYSTFARTRTDADVVPFLAWLTGAFTEKPVLFSEFGNPTCPPGKISPFDRVALPDEPPNPVISADDPLRAPFACLSENEMARYASGVLERLHADGALGAYWWCWSDYATALHHEPPFDRAPHETSFGITRSDGTAKPVALALETFAARRPVVQPPPDDDPPPFDEATYYASLPASTTAAYRMFLSGRVA